VNLSASPSLAPALVSVICGLSLGAVCAAAEPPRSAADVTSEVTRAALAHGTDFLLQAQNTDGSWGGAWDSLTTWSGETWANPESHRAWRVATTGLACLALLEAGESGAARSAVDRSLEYLIANARVKRPSEWDTMNCWPAIYGLQALAAAYEHDWYRNSDQRADIGRAAEQCIAGLAEQQSLLGGWGYLEFSLPRTARPQWATSFTTAAGIVALVEARASGLAIDDDVLRRAANAVRHCRLPNGAYTYSVQAITHPRLIGSIDRVNGSLARIQSCNLALLLAGDDVSADRLRTGLDVFFREHRFLDIARLKPVPHEAYYQNSGYFYLFGHYYAARVIEHLPPDDRRRYWPQLAYEIIKLQGPDGSIWDYDHHAYDKPYGTAYGLLALQRAARDE
jgi:hypothetical protein